MHFLWNEQKNSFKIVLAILFSEDVVSFHTQAFASSIASFCYGSQEKILQSLVVHFGWNRYAVVRGKTHCYILKYTASDRSTYSWKTRRKKRWCGWNLSLLFTELPCHWWLDRMMYLQIVDTFICHAHLLRDLQESIDSPGQKWAQQMQGFL